MIKFNINKIIIAEVPCSYCNADTGLLCLTKTWNPRPLPHQERTYDYFKKKELEKQCSSINKWWDGRDREEKCILDKGHNDRHMDGDGYFWENKGENNGASV